MNRSAKTGVIALFRISMNEVPVSAIRLLPVLIYYRKCVWTASQVRFELRPYLSVSSQVSTCRSQGYPLTTTLMVWAWLWFGVLTSILQELCEPLLRQGFGTILRAQPHHSSMPLCEFGPGTSHGAQPHVFFCVSAEKLPRSSSNRKSRIASVNVIRQRISFSYRSFYNCFPKKRQLKRSTTRKLAFRPLVPWHIFFCFFPCLLLHDVQ